MDELFRNNNTGGDSSGAPENNQFQGENEEARNGSAQPESAASDNNPPENNIPDNSIPDSSYNNLNSQPSAPAEPSAEPESENVFSGESTAPESKEYGYTSAQQFGGAGFGGTNPPLQNRINYTDVLPVTDYKPASRGLKLFAAIRFVREI